MRIIAGEFRGRKLLPPEGETTRPVTDRVKQSVFDIVSPLLPGALVYDCFAGTGSMGLECLSRGGSRTLFFEADRSALARLQKNIAAMRVGDRCAVVPGNLFDWFDAAPPPPHKAALLFLDPPYRLLAEKPEALGKLAIRLAERHLAPGAVVVFRHDARDTLSLPSLALRDRRDYGSMRVEFLSPANIPSTQP